MDEAVFADVADPVDQAVSDPLADQVLREVAAAIPGGYCRVRQRLPRWWRNSEPA